mmetsp:Transcript_458/g.678  ORF Transcript_458/g.678 Transcript_458/m.678 type:complete len:93 (-) Transcript_458:466-744(-)
MDESPKAALPTLKIDENSNPWCDWLMKPLINAVYGNGGDTPNHIRGSPLRRVSSFRFPSSTSCPCNSLPRRRSRSTIRGPLGDSLSRDFTEL